MTRITVCVILSIFLICTNSIVIAQESDHWHPPLKLTDSIPCPPVSNQGMSPTCWAFGSNSLFESDLLKKFGLKLNLSEMFYARYAYIDKANQYLKSKGTTYFAGGGQFHDIIRVISKYGMLPESLYNGRPGEETLPDHAKLEAAMLHVIKKFLKEGKTILQSKEMRMLNDTLDKYLGKVPGTFLYNNKRYTPKKFARDIIHFSNNYAELVSFSDKDLHKKFMLDDKFNWAHDSFNNVTLDELQQATDTALSRGWSVGWEGDVTEPGFNFYEGYATVDFLPDSLNVKRLLNYKDESTERDHMLHLVGVGYDSTGKKWYYLKNSWGNYNWLKGYLYMDEKYFRCKTVILFINKEGLPKSLKEKLGLN